MKDSDAAIWVMVGLAVVFVGLLALSIFAW
jgi:hypothetical protein